MGRYILGNKRTQVLTLVGARFLTLDIAEVNIPMLQDLSGELPFLRGHQHDVFGLSKQAAYIVERTIWYMQVEPALTVGGDPGTPHLVKRMRQRAD